MKKLLILSFVMISLMGCANMSEKQKRTNWIVAGVLVGAVIISSGNGDTIVHNNVRCLPHNNSCGENESEN